MNVERVDGRLMYADGAERTAENVEQPFLDTHHAGSGSSAEDLTGAAIGRNAWVSLLSFCLFG